MQSFYFVDKEGNTYGIPHAGNKPRVSSMPYLYDVAEGNIPNHISFRQIGRNGDVDNLLEDLWDVGGVYVYPPAGGIQMQVSSTSANDSAAGIGARQVAIHYLDSSYNEQSETITLNGVTPVNTVATNILRVNGFHVITVGSNGYSVGSIRLHNVGATIFYSQVSAGYNVSFQAIYTVPLGKILYITDWQVGIGAAGGGKFGEFVLKATCDVDGTLMPGVFQIKDIVPAQDGQSSSDLAVPVKIPAMADIKISVTSDAANANAICSGHFEGWMETI